MAKKRQPDFSKNQLKPGRALTRKRNPTNTSFKAKKIVMQTKDSELSILDCLKSIKSGSPVRLPALLRLEYIVVNHQEFFIPNLVEVFKSLVRLLLEVDDKIRKHAVQTMEHIFGHYNKKDVMKISSLKPDLIQALSCGMTNSVLRIKETTLAFLQFILKDKPFLICDSNEILINFYKMITVAPRKLSHPQSRSMPVIYDNRMSSDNYRMRVLECMKLFLGEMLKKSKTDDDLEEEKDEQEVYWNCERPLHLEIYAGGGLKPVDIEKTLVNNVNSQELNFADSTIIDEFIIPVVTLVPEIFNEVIGDHRKSDDNHFDVKIIGNLNILFQVLCHLTDWIKSEWMQLIPCEEVYDLISSFLKKQIFLQNLFPLYPSGRTFGPNNKGTEAPDFNLAVCFLYGKILLHDEYANEKYLDNIITYIKSLFLKNYDINCNSIPMLVEILDMYYDLHEIHNVSDFIDVTLTYLSKLLKYREDGCKKDVLKSLFIKLSLRPAYDFLNDTEAMRNWFNWVLNQLTNYPKSGKVDKILLQFVKKIANRKHPCFLEAVAKIEDNKFKAMLKYDNPDVRDTTIFLIYNQKDISLSFFEDISNVILLDTSFPVQYAIRLIRLLTCRYVEKHRSKDKNVDLSAFKRGRIDFIQFLLNIAVDSLNMTNEKWLDYDANEYTKAMEPFKDVTKYNIFPSLHWKEHSKIFEVCQKSLSLLPEKLVNNVALLMVKEILENIINFPMHCAIAILKLTYKVRDRHFCFLINSFIFSTLLTTSVLTHMSTEDEWYEYSMVELIDNVKFSRQVALETLEQQLKNVEEIDGIAVYHILRICQFYLERRLFTSDDSKRLLNILEGFKDKCTDKTFKHQPLYVKLCHYIYYDLL